MGVEITITNPLRRGLAVTLLPGEELVFGSSQGGVGRISESSAVSRRHGTVHAANAGFSVTATGSTMGFTVADRTTPSRLTIPRGVGPVAIPFAQCSLIVEYQGGFGYLNVSVSGSEQADRWAASWGPQLRELWAAAKPGLMTTPPWPKVNWRKSNGAPYRWFTTLIALCEPALSDRPAGTPTNTQLAHRLGLAEKTIEEHITAIYRAFDLGAEASRDFVVASAVEQGIVTAIDIESTRSERKTTKSSRVVGLQA